MATSGRKKRPALAKAGAKKAARLSRATPPLPKVRLTAEVTAGG